MWQVVNSKLCSGGYHSDLLDVEGLVMMTACQASRLSGTIICQPPRYHEICLIEHEAVRRAISCRRKNPEAVRHVAKPEKPSIGLRYSNGQVPPSQ